MAFSSAVAIFAVATAVNVKLQMDAQKTQKEQFKQSQETRKQAEAKQKELADLQTVRAKRQAVREAQVRRAEIENSAEQTGGGGSSSLEGSTGSIATQAGSTVSFLDTANRLSSQASTLFGDANEIANRPIQISPIPGAVAGLSAAYIGNSTKINAAAKNIFSSPSSTT